MKNLGKKITVLAMVGIMQVGFGAAVIEASPLHNNHSHKLYKGDHRPDHRDRHAEHDERMKKENDRHEREMKRRHNEDEREWRERQEREKQKHEDNLREIGALLIGIAIGANS
ncbi:hypothetical protein [Anaerosinus massiliensis]|uniref:hypothetical protein n=1 Tax=Massilibacillus massiliensis TaxID=1806837 RepID=UPI000DA5EEFC|nr:hypothetical protein [Massilibacillus massiliensis]